MEQPRVAREGLAQATGFTLSATPTTPVRPSWHVSFWPIVRLVCLTVVAITASVLARGEVSYPRFPLAQLQADFDQARAIMGQHPKLYADTPALNAALDAARGQLRDQMSELEFLRVLAPLVRRLNCGHSRIELSSATQTATSGQRRLLPFACKVIDGRLFIVKTLPAQVAMTGLEIVSLNDRSAGEILAQLYENLGADGANLTLKQSKLSRGYDFSVNYYLFVDAAESFTVAYRTPIERTTATLSVDGAVPSELTSLRRVTPPLEDGVGWSEFTADYALLAISTFSFSDEPGRARFNGFIDRFFNEVAARRSPAVILDLRLNGGGDPYCGSYLVSHLVGTAAPYFTMATWTYPDLKAPRPVAPNAFAGPLYTLIDGGSFSTTGHVCGLLKFNRRGRFIGEESAGNYVCTAGAQTTALTYTQLRFTCATSIFESAVSGLETGRGIFPDTAVTPTVEDILGERDVVKDTAVAFARGATSAPAIISGAASHSVRAGDTVAMSVTATGPALRYQWQRDGRAIEGATSRILVVPAVTASHAGDYRATITNPFGRETTSPATLAVVDGPAAPRISNVSVRTEAAPGDRTLIVGFALTESTRGAEVLIRGIGPQLRAFGVSGALDDPQLAVFPAGAALPCATNDDWAGNDRVRQACTTTGAFPLTDARSCDAALVASLASGLYSVHLSPKPATAGTVLGEIYALGSQHLANVSARAQVDGTTPLIAGFVLEGTSARTVVIRGLGPALQPFVGAAATQDPHVSVYRHERGEPVRVATAEDWDALPITVEMVRRSGAFSLPPGPSKDAVLIATLEPGVYTVHVTPVAGDGVALVEAYAIE